MNIKENIKRIGARQKKTVTIDARHFFPLLDAFREAYAAAGPWKSFKQIKDKALDVIARDPLCRDLDKDIAEAFIKQLHRYAILYNATNTEDKENE